MPIYFTPLFFKDTESVSFDVDPTWTTCTIAASEPDATSLIEFGGKIETDDLIDSAFIEIVTPMSLVADDIDDTADIRSGCSLAADDVDDTAYIVMSSETTYNIATDEIDDTAEITATTGNGYVIAADSPMDKGFISYLQGQTSVIAADEPDDTASITCLYHGEATINVDDAFDEALIIMNSTTRYSGLTLAFTR